MLLEIPPFAFEYLDQWVLKLLDWGFSIMGLFAFIHAVTQRTDAYTAAERMTKPAWLGITGGGAAALMLFAPAGFTLLFWLAGLIAVLVYMVDVRPKLIEVQRGPRW